MREFEFRAMQQANNRKMALLFRQFQFLESRIRAYETVLGDRKAMLRSVWSPTWLSSTVDAIQTRLLQISNEETKKQDVTEKIILSGANGNGRG